MFVYPSDERSLVMKSIEISDYTQPGIRSSFKNLYYSIYYTLLFE